MSVETITVAGNRSDALRLLGWLKREKNIAPSFGGVFGSERLDQAVQAFVEHLRACGRTYATCAGYIRSFIAVARFVHAARVARAPRGAAVSTAAVDAMRRAHRCAGQWGAACVLSPEVGFSVPAAFLYDHQQARMRMIVAPKLVALDSEEQARASQVYVRVSPPDGDGILGTRTVTFNDTVVVEFLNDEKQLVREKLTGDNAFCVQLLRRSFDASCWHALD